MIFPITYPKRRRLDHADGMEPARAIGPASALAFYNTDSQSKQEQSSTQTGAYNGGVALNGVTINQNSNSSGSKGGGSSKGNSSGYGSDAPADSGGGPAQIVSINTDTNAGAAIAALETALKESSANTGKLADTFSQLAEKTTTANSGTAGMNTIQTLGTWASIAGGAYLAWHFIFRKK